MSKLLDLARLRIDGGTQSRVALNQSAIDDYADALAEGVKLPPVIVFFDGTAHWLADGFHRYFAHKQAKRAGISADIQEGTQRDAILFSVGANAAHGLRRSNEDKRRAVQTVLADAEWSQWSDREIARQCGVTHPFVARLRAPETVAPQPEARGNVSTPEAREEPRQVVTVTTPAASEPAYDEQDDRLAEASHTITTLSEENETLRAKLAVEQMDVSEDEKSAAADLITELRAEVKRLTIERDALVASRDNLQATVVQLRKQIDMNARELAKARAAA